MATRAERDAIIDSINLDPSDIERWWMLTADADYQAFGPKLAEYGANDLKEIGRKLARLMNWDDITDAQMNELGCWFYLCGKVERAFEALHRHELPSDDTNHDAVVYGMMIRRIREVGELR